ncbi:VPS13, repeated coiled region [Phytophthora cactorum]|nr:VPS13, repeated coiled region [Phytophthora cactorum]
MELSELYRITYAPTEFLLGTFSQLQVAAVAKDETVVVDVSLQSIEAFDESAESSAFSRLLSRKQIIHSTGDGDDVNVSKLSGVVFLMSYEMNPANSSADASLFIHMEPLEIVLSPTARCWGRLAKFMDTPANLGLWEELEVASFNDIVNLKTRTEAKLDYVMENRIALAVDLRIQAPVIIIPESDTDYNCARLVVDLGRINFRTDRLSQMDSERMNMSSTGGPPSSRSAPGSLALLSPSQFRGVNSNTSFVQQLYDEAERGEGAIRWKEEFYDKFSLSVANIHVLLIPYGKTSRVHDDDAGSSGMNYPSAPLPPYLANIYDEEQEYELVERFNINVTVRMSILPLDATLTRFYVHADLPALTFNLSLEKYFQLMALADRFSLANAEAPKKSRKYSDGGLYSPVDAYGNHDAGMPNPDDTYEAMRSGSYLSTSALKHFVLNDTESAPPPVTGASPDDARDSDENSSVESDDTWFSITSGNLDQSAFALNDGAGEVEPSLSISDLTDSTAAEHSITSIPLRSERRTRKRPRPDTPGGTTKLLDRRLMVCSFTVPLISVQLKKPRSSAVSSYASYRYDTSDFDDDPTDNGTILVKLQGFRIRVGQKTLSTQLNVSLMSLEVEDFIDASGRSTQFLLFSCPTIAAPFSIKAPLRRGGKFPGYSTQRRRPARQRERVISFQAGGTKGSDGARSRASAAPETLLELGFSSLNDQKSGKEVLRDVDLQLGSVQFNFDQSYICSLLDLFEESSSQLALVPASRGGIGGGGISLTDPDDGLPPPFELTPTIKQEYSMSVNLTESVRADLERARKNLFEQPPDDPKSSTLHSGNDPAPVALKLGVRLHSVSVCFSDRGESVASIAVLDSQVQVGTGKVGQINISCLVGDVKVFDLSSKKRQDDDLEISGAAVRGLEASSSDYIEIFGLDASTAFSTDEARNMLSVECLISTEMEPKSMTTGEGDQQAKSNLCLSVQPVRLLAQPDFVESLANYVVDGPLRTHFQSKHTDLSEGVIEREHKRTISLDSEFQLAPRFSPISDHPPGSLTPFFDAVDTSHREARQFNFETLSPSTPSRYDDGEDNDPEKQCDHSDGSAEGDGVALILARILDNFNLDIKLFHPSVVLPSTPLKDIRVSLQSQPCEAVSIVDSSSLSGGPQGEDGDSRATVPAATANSAKWGQLTINFFLEEFKFALISYSEAPHQFETWMKSVIDIPDEISSRESSGGASSAAQGRSYPQHFMGRRGSFPNEIPCCVIGELVLAALEANVTLSLEDTPFEDSQAQFQCEFLYKKPSSLTKLLIPRCVINELVKAACDSSMESGCTLFKFAAVVVSTDRKADVAGCVLSSALVAKFDSALGGGELSTSPDSSELVTASVWLNKVEVLVGSPTVSDAEQLKSTHHTGTLVENFEVDVQFALRQCFRPALEEAIDRESSDENSGSNSGDVETGDNAVEYSDDDSKAGSWMNTMPTDKTDKTLVDLPKLFLRDVPSEWQQWIISEPTVCIDQIISHIAYRDLPLLLKISASLTSMLGAEKKIRNTFIARLKAAADDLDWSDLPDTTRDYSTESNSMIEVTASCKADAKYQNLRLVTMEPLIEPWSVKMTLFQQQSRIRGLDDKEQLALSPWKLDISSDVFLQLNLTDALIANLVAADRAWRWVVNAGGDSREMTEYSTRVCSTPAALGVTVAEIGKYFARAHYPHLEEGCQGFLRCPVPVHIVSSGEGYVMVRPPEINATDAGDGTSSVMLPKAYAKERVQLPLFDRGSSSVNENRTHTETDESGQAQCTIKFRRLLLAGQKRLDRDELLLKENQRAKAARRDRNPHLLRPVPSEDDEFTDGMGNLAQQSIASGRSASPDRRESERKRRHPRLLPSVPPVKGLLDLLPKTIEYDPRSLGQLEVLQACHSDYTMDRGCVRLRVSNERDVGALDARKESGQRKWSDPFVLDQAGTIGEIEADDFGANKKFSIGYSIIPAKGQYSRTKVIMLTPRFMLINTMSSAVEVCHSSSKMMTPSVIGMANSSGTMPNSRVMSPVNPVVQLDAGAFADFHWTLRFAKTRTIRCRFAEHGWSWSGAVPLAESGEYAVRMRHESTRESKLVRVTLKLDSSCVCVYFREERTTAPPYRVENYSLETLRTHQHRVRRSEILLPHHSLDYAWDEPTEERLLVVDMLPSAAGDNSRPLRIGSFDLDKIQRYPDALGGTLGIEISTDGPTRVLRFTDTRLRGEKAVPASTHDQPAKTEASEGSALQLLQRFVTAPTVQAALHLQGVGISIVDSVPKELVYMSVSGIALDVLVSEVDRNNSGASIAGSSASFIPVLQVGLVKHEEYAGIEFIRHFSVSVLPVHVRVDGALLYQILPLLVHAKIYGSSGNADPASNKRAVVLMNGVSSNDETTRAAHSHLLLSDFNSSLDIPVKVLEAAQKDGTTSAGPTSGPTTPTMKMVTRRNSAPHQQQLISPRQNQHTALAAEIQRYTTAKYGSLGAIAAKDEQKKLYFEEFHIDPIRATVSFSFGDSAGQLWTVIPKSTGIRFGVGRGSLSLVRASVYTFLDFNTRILTAFSLGLSEACLKLDDYTGYPATRHIFQGLVQGVSGVVVAPIHSFEVNGARGVFPGLMAGAFGLVLKPLLASLWLQQRPRLHYAMPLIQHQGSA